MIEYTSGNLLDADAEALVNTVNTVGVMGKGIALMFKEAYPENFRAYARAGKAEEVRTGRMFVTRRDELLGPRWIINFPTKQHWKAKARLEWIEEGLRDLKRVIAENGIRSVAVPPLGSGNGGLDWTQVKPRIEAAFSRSEEHTSELRSPVPISYAVFCLKKKKKTNNKKRYYRHIEYPEIP